MSHCQTFEDPRIPVILANLRSVAMAKKIPAPFTLAKKLRWLNSHVHMALYYFMCHYDGHKVEEGVGDRE